MKKIKLQKLEACLYVYKHSEFLYLYVEKIKKNWILRDDQKEIWFTASTKKQVVEALEITVNVKLNKGA